jgi:hypothetical protein
MATSAAVPVTTTPEAAARITELGMQTELEQMIDHARDVFPELTRIEVVLNDRYDMGGEPGVAVEAYSRRPFDPTEPIAWNLSEWLVTHFPPVVLEHLHVSYHPGADHAR